MANNIEFKDYSIEVKSVLKDKAIAFLYEVCGELRSQTQRLSRRDTSETADSYQYLVDEGELKGIVGSDYKNAIWEEFGTGIHAIHGDGRKTPWGYVGRDGKYHVTRGKTANRPLQRAFETSESSIKELAEQYFGGI